MKSINRFIRTTVAGGILFLIPMVIIYMVIRKAMEILRKITAPWDDRLNREIFLGLDGHIVVGIAVLLVVCFLAGLFFRLSQVKSSVSKLEQNLLSHIPGYMLIKSMATDALSDSHEGVFTPIVVNEENAQRLGFLVEERGDLCTVFLPDVPKGDGGEVRIIPLSAIRKLSMSGGTLKHILANFGNGAFDSMTAKVK